MKRKRSGPVRRSRTEWLVERKTLAIAGQMPIDGDVMPGRRPRMLGHQAPDGFGLAKLDGTCNHGSVAVMHPQATGQ